MDTDEKDRRLTMTSSFPSTSQSGPLMSAIRTDITEYSEDQRHVTHTESYEGKPLSVPRCKYVKTRAYKAVQQTLEDEGRALVCGSPGAGKTYMSLVLQQRYRKEQYEVYSYRHIQDFSLYRDVNLNSKTFLVFDDIFGYFSLNKSKINNCFQVLDEIEEHFRRLQRTLTADQKEEKSSFKVLLISRTDIYQELKPRLKKYKPFLLKTLCVHDISNGSMEDLTKDEKKDILNNHISYKDVQITEEDIDMISEFEYSSLGFPYICEMFISRWNPSITPITFFQKPLEYLVEDISRLFDEQENFVKAAVLLLLILTDGSFNLAHLTEPSPDNKDPTEHFCTLREILSQLPSKESLPYELNKAAKTLMGTYVISENDVLRFSHPTIYDAVAYVVGENNQSFVLSHCSLQFIVERVVFQKNIDVSRGDPVKMIIKIGDGYIQHLLQRLITEMQNGSIAQSLSHKVLLDQRILYRFVQQMKTEGILEEVIHARDKHVNRLSFLFWSSYTGLLTDGFLDILGRPPFEVHEYLEAYLSTCIDCNVEAFKEVCKVAGNLGGKLAISTLSDIASGSEEKMLAFDHSDPKSTLTVSKRHDRNQDHLIHIASANGHKDIVELLIDEGIDINDRGGLGMTPLMYGSHFGHVELVEMLLQRDAKTDIRNDDNDNCLHLASKGGFTDIMQLLLNKMDLNCRGRYDRTPLMYAAYDGHKEAVILLIHKGANLEPEGTKINKNNSLHEACVKGNQEIVELLLNTCRMNVNMVGEKRRTPLHAACRAGKLDTVKFLISKGAKVNMLDENDSNCIHLAAMSGDVDTTKWLLENTPLRIEGQNRKHQTALIFSAMRGRLTLFQFLLERNAITNIEDTYGQTLMHYAVMGGNLEIVKDVKMKGFNTEQKNFKKQTPVMLACKFGHEDVFTFLREEGVKLNDKDDDQASCLHLACIGRNVSIVKSLLETGMFDVNSSDKHKMTPLHHAVQADSAGLIDLLIRYEANLHVGEFTLLHFAARFGCEHAIKKLLQEGMTVDGHENISSTPLMIACRYGNKNVVQLLLYEKPTQIDDKDHRGYTLLHFASPANDIGLLNILKSKGACINAKTNRGYTPLHSAAVGGAAQSVLFYIENGIPVDVLDGRQKTPLMSAMGQPKDNTEVVNVLMRCGANPSVVSSLGDSVLHAAAEFGAHINTVLALIMKSTARLNIELTNDEGNTPIMTAARHGNWKLLQFFLEKGANITTKNQKGETILHLACMCEKMNDVIIKELVNKGLNPASLDNAGKTPDDYIVDDRKKQKVADIFQKKETSKRGKRNKKSKAK